MSLILKALAARNRVGRGRVPLPNTGLFIERRTSETLVFGSASILEPIGWVMPTGPSEWSWVAQLRNDGQARYGSAADPVDALWALILSLVAQLSDLVADGTFALVARGGRSPALSAANAAGVAETMNLLRTQSQEDGPSHAE